jgi:uncharacterized protein (TIGR03084 family)
MDDILAALAAQHAELAGLLVGLDDDGWMQPSPCEGWDVADVVLHLVQTDQMAQASLHGRLAETVAAMTAGGFASNVDEGAALLVARERGLPSDELRRRWQDGADALDAAFAAADLHQRVEWVAGQLSARTLATTRLAETWIHTGDVATALGRPLPIPDRVRHIARLAWRTLPYAFGRAGRTLAGPVAFELRGPDGDAWVFTPDAPAVTTIRGDAGELCLVAARRRDPADTALTGEGPDASAVLDLVRTYA